MALSFQEFVALADPKVREVMNDFIPAKIFGLFKTDVPEGQVDARQQKITWRASGFLVHLQYYNRNLDFAVFNNGKLDTQDPQAMELFKKLQPIRLEVLNLMQS